MVPGCANPVHPPKDWRVCELSQGRAVSLAFRTGGAYGPHERHIRRIDDLVLEKLGDI